LISGGSSTGGELDARLRAAHATKPTEAKATEHRIAEIKIAKKSEPLNDWPENQMKSPKVPKRKLAQSPRSKSDTIETVIRLEKRVWEVAQQRNAAEFKKLVPADAVMIFQSGIVLQPEYLLTMNARTISRYEIRDMRAFMPNATTVILYYEALRLGQQSGAAFPSGPVVESTTWIRRGKRWVAILNQETPISS
jgi:hypothetical protein